MGMGAKVEREKIARESQGGFQVQRGAVKATRACVCTRAVGARVGVVVL